MWGCARALALACDGKERRAARMGLSCVELVALLLPPIVQPSRIKLPYKVRSVSDVTKQQPTLGKIQTPSA